VQTLVLEGEAECRFATRGGYATSQLGTAGHAVRAFPRVLSCLVKWPDAQRSVYKLGTERFMTIAVINATPRLGSPSASLESYEHHIESMHDFRFRETCDRFGEK
jgi:hypothetical protein